MIYVLPQFKTVPYSGLCISTTSNVELYRELSPFVLPAPPARNLENLWQFSKVYKCHIGLDGMPTLEWNEWRIKGWCDAVAHRYPMGKGAIPEYSMWGAKKLGYVEARKRIYATEYSKAVLPTKSYKELLRAWEYLSVRGDCNLILLDYDAYDHRQLGMTLKDVINEPKRKMGHAFVLAMMLEGVLEDCLK